MKSILLSIKPKYVAKILNGEKTIEVRKKFPKDYKGWVYIYCTKDRKYRCCKAIKYFEEFNKGNDRFGISLNGKVVARFYCDNVTEYINGGQWHEDNTFGHYNDYIKDNILEKSCLTEEELFAYCEDLAFSAIHISQLEIFDEPKELSEFKHYIKVPNHNVDTPFVKNVPVPSASLLFSLTKAPQSYQWIEV